MTWTIIPQHPRKGWRICKDKRTIAQVWSDDPAHARTVFRALAPDTPLPAELEPTP